MGVPATYQVLLNNLRQATSTIPVIPINLGMSNVSGTSTVMFSSAGDEGATISTMEQNRRASENMNRVTISTTTVDIELKERILPHFSYVSLRSQIDIPILKIDVEGHEMEVLRGMEMTLRSGYIK